MIDALNTPITYEHLILFILGLLGLIGLYTILEKSMGTWGQRGTM